MEKLVGVARPLPGSAVLSPNRSWVLARSLVRKIFLSPFLGLRARLRAPQFVLRIALGLDRKQPQIMAHDESRALNSDG